MRTAKLANQIARYKEKNLSRLDDLLAERHQIVAFRNLAEPYQLALVHYMAVDGEAWDALSEVPYGASADEIRNAIIGALPQYVGRYGDCQFGVVALPVGDVLRSVMQDEEIRDAFSDWAHYHAWYLGCGDVPEHGPTDRWPVILSGYDDETLQDGWHRLHSYVRAGHSDIPAVFYPELRHLTAFKGKRKCKQ